MQLGEKIRNVRSKFGLTQKELAEHIGKSEDAVKKWEQNKSTPPLEACNKISLLFDVPADYWFDLPSKEAAEVTKNLDFLSPLSKKLIDVIIEADRENQNLPQEKSQPIELALSNTCLYLKVFSVKINNWCIARGNDYEISMVPISGTSLASKRLNAASFGIRCDMKDLEFVCGTQSSSTKYRTRPGDILVFSRKIRYELTKGHLYLMEHDSSIMIVKCTKEASEVYGNGSGFLKGDKHAHLEAININIMYYTADYPRGYRHDESFTFIAEAVHMLSDSIDQ